MNTFIIVAPAFAGIYLLFGAFMLKTDNLISSFCFKFLPFTFGSASILASLKLGGIV